MESADIVLWRRQGLRGSWLLPFVEHSVGLWNMEGVVSMIKWISASGERYTPTVKVLREFQGSLPNNLWIQAEIDFRDYTATIKAWPSIGGRWAYEVTPLMHANFAVIVFQEWLHQRKEEAKTEGGMEA